jgi:Cu-Zn family superoxide dismutase
MRITNQWMIAALFASAIVACDGGYKRTAEQTSTTVERENTLDRERVGTDDGRDDEKWEARADISPASGSELTGSVTFTTTDDGKVEFELTVQNGEPGEHAVHLHENGDCSAPDATSAGGHWNPTNEPHGKRGTDTFHKGDIANMLISADGTGYLNMTIDGWSIGGDDQSNILNKAVIIHAKADDFTSQPSGAAGDRIGCGVINSIK